MILRDDPAILDILGSKAFAYDYQESENLKTLIAQLKCKIKGDEEKINNLVERPEPILHAPPLSVFEIFMDRMSAKIDQVIRREEFTAEEAVYREANLLVAIKYIEDHGNISLGETLNAEEWRRIEAYERKCERWDAPGEIKLLFESDELELDDIASSYQVKHPFEFAYLPPRGRAIYFHFMRTHKSNARKEVLSQRITECYGLPEIDSYDSLIWKYGYPLTYSMFIQPEFWQTFSIPAIEKLRPISPEAVSFIRGPKRYLELRKEMIDCGINEEDLKRIEERYTKFIMTDAHSRSFETKGFAVTLISQMLRNDNPLLHEEIRRECKSDLRGLEENSVGTLNWQRIRTSLYSALESDLLRFCIFYAELYDWKQITEDSRYLSGKLGQPKTLVKTGTDQIHEELWKLIHDAGIKYPYDKTAEVLNAISRTAIYNMDSPEAGTTLTKGGHVLKMELKRLRAARPNTDKTVTS